MIYNTEKGRKKREKPTTRGRKRKLENLSPTTYVLLKYIDLEKWEKGRGGV